MTRLIDRLSALPSLLLYALLFLTVVLLHLTLLHLPYFWDEGGYYIPAALDFYQRGAIIPHFTNAHPPLPNILLGTLWHLTGFHIVATRLFICAVAAAALLAVLRLGQSLCGNAVALTVTALTMIYPIWYVQSSLAHADIFAAAFTLWALAVYLPCYTNTKHQTQNSKLASGISKLAANPLIPAAVPYIATALLFSLAALSKETAIVAPVALAALHLYQALRSPTTRRQNLRWAAALLAPVLPLAAWFAYHRWATGFTFGNPEFLRYNATANLTAAHIATSLWYRFLHLFWQRNIWLPIVLAAACLFLPRRDAGLGSPARHAVILSEGSQLYREPQSKDPESLSPATAPGPFPTAALPPILVLIAANWLAFSILGGALLTRYLLPIYPLILLLCVALWRSRTRYWPAMATLTAAAFIAAWWLNPPTSFAPEDNLTYRNMIVVHQRAINFVAAHYPQATILTAWPVAADVFRPELGYVSHPLRATSIDNFTLAEIQKAQTEPERYDTAIVFTTHYLDPGFRAWLNAHPDSARGRDFAITRDLTPQEIAALLHGTVIQQWDIDGEWAAVLRFSRSYEASLR